MSDRRKREKQPSDLIKFYLSSIEIYLELPASYLNDVRHTKLSITLEQR